MEKEVMPQVEIKLECVRLASGIADRAGGDVMEIAKKLFDWVTTSQMTK